MVRLRLLVVASLVALAGCGEDAGEGPVPDDSPASLNTTVQPNESVDAEAPPNEAIGVVPDTSGAAEVTVAGSAVPRRGVVTDIEAEYQICRLTVRADNGSTTEIYGDFSLCETDGLVGQRAQFDYVPGTIPAESCGDDPMCLETQTIALAVVAQPLGRPASRRE